MKRRDFMKYGAAAGAAGACSPFLAEFYRLLLQGVISKAQAQATGSTARRYVSINLMGAPMRYTFDQWLKTNADDPFMGGNAQVANCLRNQGGQVQAVYETFTHTRADGSKIEVPPFFKGAVSISRGTVPLTDLLSNMMVIRGYGSSADGHPSNNVLQQAPLVGKVSLAGAVADTSTRNLEAVQWPATGDYSRFVSDKRIAPNAISSVYDPLQELTKAAQSLPQGRDKAALLKSNHKDMMDLAKSRLRSHIHADRTGSAGLAKAMENAERMVATTGADALDFWNSAVRRYHDIALAAYRQENADGFTNLDLTVDGRTQNQDNPWTVDSGGRMYLAAGQDLKQAIRGSEPYLLAEGFALLEFLLTQNLATSIELRPAMFMLSARVDGLRTANLPNFQTGNFNTNALAFSCDMHEAGAISATLITGAWYRGLCACLLELKDVLNASKDENGNNQWENTVMHVISDFGRAPRKAGNGSDHGFFMMVSSVLSGAFADGPHVLGNVSKNGYDSNYAGTIGMKAAIPVSGALGYGNNPMGPEFMGTHVAALLGLPDNPYKNFVEPLISLDAGTKTLVNHGLPKAKVVG